MRTTVDRDDVTLLPGWFASLLAATLMLVLVGRVAANLGDQDAIPAREQRATTAAGAVLLAVFVLQWKGFVPELVDPAALVLPGLLLVLYPEPKGPTG